MNKNELFKQWYEELLKENIRLYEEVVKIYNTLKNKNSYYAKDIKNLIALRLEIIGTIEQFDNLSNE